MHEVTTGKNLIEVSDLCFSYDRAEQALCDNGTILLDALAKAKPKSLKGVFLKSAYLSCTMGPGVRLDISKYLREVEADE